MRKEGPTETFWRDANDHSSALPRADYLMHLRKSLSLRKEPHPRNSSSSVENSRRPESSACSLWEGWTTSWLTAHFMEIHRYPGLGTGKLAVV